MLLRHRILSQKYLPPTQTFARACKSSYSNGKLSPKHRLDRDSALVHVPNTRPRDDVHSQGNIADAVNSGVQSYKVSVTKSMTGHLVDEQAFRQAMLSGDPTVIENVVKDCLQLRDSKATDVKSRNFLNFLIHYDVLRVLKLPTLLAVLSTFRPPAVILPPLTIERLVYRLASSRQSENVNGHLIAIYPHILLHLGQLTRADPRAVLYTPPEIVRSAFRFLNAFLPIDKGNALSIFTILANTYHIPSSAMVESSSSQTLEQIISVSLVKASLYWNWYDIAEDILSKILVNIPAPDPFIIRHATDCLYTLLISPSSTGLERCLKIIRMLHPLAPVPDNIIRQFYHSALEVDATGPARDLYEFSKDPTVLEAHSYPVPPGSALAWLMTFLVERSQRDHLSRALAADVAEGGLPIPMPQRAKFISLVAAQGFASSARTLWEHYASGKDDAVIHGNPSLLIRMVSLFTRVAQTQEDKGETAAGQEFRSFAYHVLTVFKQHHTPWDTAQHWVLTSYARACFIIGKNTEGFRVFKALLRRFELPDMYDINVVLSAIAAKSPTAAARMLKKMEKNGVKPDAVSIGTVLHHASIQGQEQVKEEMTQRAMEMENIFSDVQAFGALIRAVVQMADSDTSEQRDSKLQIAWDLVSRFTESGTRTSTRIGNYLVSLALQAENALLAFRFWKALLDKSADYDDSNQRTQRGAIVKLAKWQNQQGKISGTDIRMIINELNESRTVTV